MVFHLHRSLQNYSQIQCSSLPSPIVVTAVIFLAPLSTFDENLAEDPQVNRLEDTLRLWRALVQNQLWRNVDIILFFNKLDLLKVRVHFVFFFRSNHFFHFVRPLWTYHTIKFVTQFHSWTWHWSIPVDFWDMRNQHRPSYRQEYDLATTWRHIGIDQTTTSQLQGVRIWIFMLKSPCALSLSAVRF